METKEIKIIPPEGCEIDFENSTFECIRFKKIGRPNSWESYAKNNNCVSYYASCGDWKPNWEDYDSKKYSIISYLGDVIATEPYGPMVFTFPSRETRDDFLETFKDLLDEAKMFF